MGFFFEMLFSAYVIVSCNVKCDYLLLVPLSTNSLSMHNYYFFFLLFYVACKVRWKYCFPQFYVYELLESHRLVHLIYCMQE